MKKIKKINGIQNGDNFVGSGFYFLSLTLSLITLVMQSISVEIEYESVPFAFISFIIVLGVTILLFILWIILNERTTVYYGAIIFLFTTILNTVFLRRGC